MPTLLVSTSVNELPPTHRRRMVLSKSLHSVQQVLQAEEDKVEEQRNRTRGPTVIRQMTQI